MKELTIGNSRSAVLERRKLYHSPRWRHFRKAYLMDEPWCVLCKETGRLVHATILDHKNGHGHDWHVHFWTGPFQGLCAKHHAWKTADEVKPSTSRPWRRSAAGGSVET